MEQISTLIEILDYAGIKYDVDQTMDEDGGSRTLEVCIYDKNNSVAIFEFDAYNDPNLLSFRIPK
jgi:hypothetical protein